MTDELKKIKNIYGEKMMHLCRDLFPSILETPGKLLAILEDNIAPTHSFAEDIIENNYQYDFEKWIHSLSSNEIDIVDEITKTPFELMDEAGYTLYECKSEEDIQRFKKYYEQDERLCTFNGGRLDRCYVFFAVKKNVNEIKRKDFTEPHRQDRYGTSVISIQFTREGGNTLSIKNRYNHSVDNPDATFSNNLENIIPGLTKSFENYYGYKINNHINKHGEFITLRLPYVRASDGKLYRYNLEIDDHYYCENNIIVDGSNINKTYAENKERYLVIDQFIIDRQDKHIIFYLVGSNRDGFPEIMDDIGTIKRIDVRKEKDYRIIDFIYDDNKIVTVKIDKHNAIIGYDNKYIENIPNNFLHRNIQLKEINIPNAVFVAHDFLNSNKELTSISLPNVTFIQYNFLRFNEVLKNINLPKVEHIDWNFLESNTELEEIDLPSVTYIGSNFLRRNEHLHSISLPNVRDLQENFLACNHDLEKIDLPNVDYIDQHFLVRNDKIEEISFPKLKEIYGFFLSNDTNLKRVYLPELIKTGDYFLDCSQNLDSIDLPKVETIGDFFISLGKSISHVNLPNVQRIGRNFLHENEILKTISLPNVISIDHLFLNHNTSITKIYMPKVKDIGSGFLYNNKILSTIDLPNILVIKSTFLYWNNAIKEIYFPHVREIGGGFLRENKIIEKIDIPEIIIMGKNQSSTILSLINEQLKKDRR